jgi:pimeloyl-ACP methyl ester carboxylesterase
VLRTTEPGTVQLRDGRRIAYADLGDRDGAPCLFFHGTPGTRLWAGAIDGDASAAGVRLVALDRPGLGRSDPAPGRTLSDWADDVGEVADALGLDRFAVAGFSGGGVHALACGWRLPQRVTTCIVLGGVAPPADMTGEGLARFNRLVFESARRAPAVLPALWTVLRVATKLEREPAEGPSLGERVRWHLWLDGTESFRHGIRPSMHDYLLNMQPWPFEPEDVICHVDLLHGRGDRNVPVASARRLAERLPDCEARFVHGDHFVMVRDAAEVLSWVRAAA